MNCECRRLYCFPGLKERRRRLLERIQRRAMERLRLWWRSSSCLDVYTLGPLSVPRLKARALGRRRKRKRRFNRRGKIRGSQGDWYFFVAFRIYYRNSRVAIAIRADRQRDDLYTFIKIQRARSETRRRKGRRSLIRQLPIRGAYKNIPGQTNI